MDEAVSKNGAASFLIRSSAHRRAAFFCFLTQYGHRSYGNGEALIDERDRLRQPQYDSVAWWQGAL